MDNLRGVFIHDLIPKDREKKGAKKEYHNGGIKPHQIMIG